MSVLWQLDLYSQWPPTKILASYLVDIKKLILKFIQGGKWKVKVLVSQLCQTLGNAIDCSFPGSSFHGILQARILEWVAMPSSRGSSQTRNWTLISCVFYIGRWILYLLPSVGSFTFSLWALQGIFFLASHLNLYSLTMKNQPQKLYFSLEIDLFPKSQIWQKLNAFQNDWSSFFCDSLCGLPWQHLFLRG